MPSKSDYAKLPTTKKPLRRLICRFADSSGKNNKYVQQEISNQPVPAKCGDSSGSGQIELSGLNSPDNSNPGNVPKQVKELEETLPRFGPLCGKDVEVVKHAKEGAWQHIVAKAPEEERDSLYGTYYSAIKKIDEEARATYDPDILKNLKKSEFQKMMIIDGCFFLQLTLFILGGSEPLGYPENHPYFGSGNYTENRRMKAMFFAGNQIPCVVLQQLMKQSFFQEVISKGKWSMPSDDLPKMALYLFVVSPQLAGKKAPYYFHEEPTDLLQAFHCLVVGHGVGDYKVDEDDGDESELDLKSGTEEDPNSRDIFPSATELEQSGIKLAKAEGGIREICFRHLWLFHGRLYVPPFTFGSNPELILRYLKEYEIAQKQGKNNNREVAAYLCFMRDLIRTPMDVFVLQRRGIIQRQNRTRGDKLPRMLRRLCSEETTSAQNVFLAKIAIKEYGSPQKRFIIKVTLFLTLIQAVFAVLSYIPRK